MTKKLDGIKIAMLACDGFEESEMVDPRTALQEAGASVDLITSKQNYIKGWKHDHWTKAYKVNKKLGQVNPANYDAIVLPGGVMNPDKLRTDKKAIAFVKHFFKNQKLVAAICHAPLTLIETKQLKNRRMTSYHSIKTDLKNAGANWQNKPVVIDKNLITSRKPDDIPAFNKAIITYLMSTLMSTQGAANGTAKRRAKKSAKRNSQSARSWKK